jgi:flagellar basal-body rod protein FlgF
MDNLLYIAMSGAKEGLNGLSIRGNNLANANTTGFKADFQQARAIQAFGEGMPTRVFALTESPGHNFAQGAIKTTGRDLDLAIEGSGWLSIQDADGQEALTRNGNLQISAAGVLQTTSGQTVLGEGNNPIILPLPIEKLEINRDGTIQVRPEGAPVNAMEEIDRIKLSNPEAVTLKKGNDGLYRVENNGEILADANVTVMKGALESSNVNPVEEMTSLISLQRHFEMQVKMMKTAEDNDRSATKLMSLRG